MKKYAAIVILFLVALLAWNSLSGSDMHVLVDGEEFDGPLGTLIGIVAGTVGLLVAGVALLVAGTVLALVFAGLGVAAIFGLLLGAVVLAIAVSPLLLPLLVPVGIIWFFMRRNRRLRASQAPVATA